MILDVKNIYDKTMDKDRFKLKTSMLKQNTVHLFIAANAWEEIDLELSEEIPKGSLIYMPKICGNIKVVIPEKVTEHIMQLLTELYPELSGKIRKSFMMGKDLREVIPECGVL